MPTPEPPAQSDESHHPQPLIWSMFVNTFAVDGGVGSGLVGVGVELVLPEPEVVPVPEPDVVPESEPDPEVEVVPDPELVPLVDPEVDVDPEPELDVEPELVPVVVDPLVVDPEVEPELPELELELVDVELEFVVVDPDCIEDVCVCDPVAQATLNPNVSAAKRTGKTAFCLSIQ